MYRLWKVVEPLLTAIDPDVVIEIGSDAGHQTKLLAGFCQRRGAVLHVIDPLPKYDVNEMADRFAGSFEFHRELSVDILPQVPAPDAVLIDGDHNYYTVSRELEQIEASTAGTFPLVLLHDVGWPYGRRDLYYDPATIPAAARHPWRRAGLLPGEPDPRSDVAFNAHLANAVDEGTPANGVLTAVEDFLSKRTHLRLETLPVVHGLGIVYDASALELHPRLREVLGRIRLDPMVTELLQDVEKQRVELHVEIAKLKRDADARVARAREAVHASDRALGDAEERARRAEEELENLAQKAQAALERDELRERQLQQARSERGAAQERAADLEARVQVLDLRYQRLTNRRIVRFSLELAALARPAFKVVRRLRSRGPGTKDPGTVSSARVADPGPDRVALLLRHGDEPPPVTVIVPTFNAPAAVADLVDSLTRHVTSPDSVLLIDDASTDPGMADVLERVEALPRFRVLRNVENLGFTRTVNRGLASCDGDVVVLNSDTVVGPKWLRNLQLAAYSDERVALASPLSDNAGVFSAPREGGSNELPPDMSWDEASMLVARSSQRLRPEIPTAHGFCMYIRRDALDDVGGLDAEAFPRGYGEETEFSLRARERGWKCLLDDRTYIRHLQAASFGSERESLIRAGRAIIDRRFPRYTSEVAQLKTLPTLRDIRASVGQALEERRPVKRRVLSVIHDGGGGTPQTNLDLMCALNDSYETRVLRSRIGSLLLERPSDRGVEWSQPIVPGWRITDIERDDLRRTYLEVLEDWDPDLLHIRHLIGHSFDLPRAARALRIPVILSLHDFYLACPTIHLLDETGRFCGGRCTDTPGPCLPPTRKLAGHPPLKHAWVHEWRRHVTEMFRYVDALVTTTPDAVTVFQANFDPELMPPIEVIEHGRDFDERIDAARAPRPGEPLRVLLLGNTGRNKGGDVLAAVKALDEDERIEYHFLGDVAPAYRDLGVWHGTYDRREVLDEIARAQPSVIAILSTWPETYSHTLTEAWAAGVPVVASNLGALKDRVQRSGGGWLADVTDPLQVYRLLLGIADGAEDWARRHEEAKLADIRSVATMAAAYEALYERVLEGSGSSAVERVL
jgi:GT2 family glycosyltransferase/glycosyltransferase involved in cell wall biosynthesis